MRNGTNTPNERVQPKRLEFQKTGARGWSGKKFKILDNSYSYKLPLETFLSVLCQTMSAEDVKDTHADVYSGRDRKIQELRDKVKE